MSYKTNCFLNISCSGVQTSYWFWLEEKLMRLDGERGMGDGPGKSDSMQKMCADEDLEAPQGEDGDFTVLYFSHRKKRFSNSHRRISKSR